jgi:hypothetical protein
MCIFFYGKRNDNHELSACLFCIRESYQQKVKFVSDRTSYIILRYALCDIIVLNVNDFDSLSKS